MGFVLLTVADAHVLIMCTDTQGKMIKAELRIRLFNSDVLSWLFMKM